MTQLSKFLKHKALGIRIDSIRSTTEAGSGHPTSCLSVADIISVLFFNVFKYDYDNPRAANNDRFVLSKGHAIPVFYAALKQLGVISDEKLMGLRKFDSELEGHPTPRFKYNEAATGSLGQGLSVGLGMALAAKKDNLSYKTYVILGDGEVAEGSVWEAAELADHYKTDNLIAILDCNRWAQSDQALHAHQCNRYVEKFTAFGWKTFLIDGHDMDQILEAFEKAQQVSGQPVMIVAKTFKGHGIDGIEDKNGFHGVPFKKEELEQKIDQLKQRFADDIDPSIHSLTSLEITPDYAKDTTGRQGERGRGPGSEEDVRKNASSHAHPEYFAKQNVSKEFKCAEYEQQVESLKEIFSKDKKLATRKAFGHALAALGRVSDNVMVVDADVKNSTFTQTFEKEFPERFIQCFIAEQNMVGVATGLTQRGKIAFAATFGAFFSRAYDQIRMAGIGRVPLRLVGSHCGVSIGEDGPSQMALEDLAMMRAIPASIVLYPSDAVSTYKLTGLMAGYTDGISYMRTTRADTPILYDFKELFEVGGSKVLRSSDNDQVCIVAAGITLHETLKAYDLLKQEGIHVSVIDLYSIKPLDSNTLMTVGRASCNRIITVEDHYVQGGLGEAVMSGLVNSGIKITSLAVNQVSRSGSPDELMTDACIAAEAIVGAVRSLS